RPAGVVAAAMEIVQRLDAVTGDDDFVRDAMGIQGRQRQLNVVLAVLGEQNLSNGRDHGFSLHLGSVTTNVAPRSTSPTAEMRPPCRTIVRLTLARPMPVPSNSLDRCSRWNTPKSLSTYRMSN